MRLPDVAALFDRCTEGRQQSDVGALRTKQEDHLRFGRRWRVLREVGYGAGEAAARLGITVSNIDTTLSNGFSQRQVGVIYNPLNQYRVVLELAPQHLQRDDSLARMQFINSLGQSVPLSAFAKIELTNTPFSTMAKSSP